MGDCVSASERETMDCTAVNSMYSNLGNQGASYARCLSGPDLENVVDASVFDAVLEDVQSAERVAAMGREVWKLSANARLPGLAADSGVAMCGNAVTIDATNPVAHTSIARRGASNFRATTVDVENSHPQAHSSSSDPRFMGMGSCMEDMPTPSCCEQGIAMPWHETDAAFLFLFLWETQEQECHEAMQRWCIDPFTFQLLMVQDMAVLVDDEWKAGLRTAAKWRERLQQYLLQNILQVGYGFPCMASTNIPASLRAYIDTIGRFQRIMRSMRIEEGSDQTLPATSTAVLHSLPTLIIGMPPEEASKMCIICKEKLEPSSVASRLPCLHVYHTDCILPWLKQRNNCPICRHELPTDDLDYELQKKIKLLTGRVS